MNSTDLIDRLTAKLERCAERGKPFVLDWETAQEVITALSPVMPDEVKHAIDLLTDPTTNASVSEIVDLLERLASDAATWQAQFENLSGYVETLTMKTKTE